MKIGRKESGPATNWFSKITEYLISKDQNAATASSEPHPVDSYLAGVASTKTAHII
jgi:hypothetical protein